MMHYHYIQSIYHDHRKNKREDAMVVSAMFSLVQHSFYQTTIQYSFKFPEQMGSHRPWKTAPQMLNPIFSMNHGFFLNTSIYFPDPHVNLYPVFPTTCKFILIRKTPTTKCDMELQRRRAPSSLHSRSSASFFCVEWEVCSRNCLETDFF